MEVVGHDVDPVERRGHVRVLEGIDSPRPGADCDGEELSRPDRAAERRQKQHVVVRVARLSRLKAAGHRMFPVDVDAVELRIRLQELRAGPRERLAVLFGRRHFIERSGIRPASNGDDELQVWMLLFEQRDLMEESMLARGLTAVAGIDAVDRDGPVEGQLVVGVDLAECVIDVCQLVGGNVSKRIPFGGPVRVVADDFEVGRRRRHCVLRMDRRKQAAQCREDERHDGHGCLSNISVLRELRARSSASSARDPPRAVRETNQREYSHWPRYPSTAAWRNSARASSRRPSCCNARP